MSAAPTETTRRLVVASMKLVRCVTHGRENEADDIEGSFQSGKAVMLTVSMRSTEWTEWGFFAVSRVNAKIARLRKWGDFDERSDTRVTCGRCLYLGN